MIERPFWIKRIEEAWRTVPVVWCPEAGGGYGKSMDGLDISVVDPGQWLAEFSAGPDALPR